MPGERFSTPPRLPLFLNTKHDVRKGLKIGPTVDIHRTLKGRKESLTDAGPEVSLLCRKALGTWHTSGLLHIPAMGNPWLPRRYFQFKWIDVSCQYPPCSRQRGFTALRSSFMSESSKCKSFSPFAFISFPSHTYLHQPCSLSSISYSSSNQHKNQGLL